MPDPMQPDLCVGTARQETFGGGVVVQVELVGPGLDVDGDVFTFVIRLDLGADDPLVEILAPVCELFFAVAWLKLDHLGYPLGVSRESRKNDSIQTSIVTAAPTRRGATGLPAARLLLTVHDELVLEGPEGQVEDLSELVRAEMGGVAELAVPLVVDVGIGQTWYDAKG